MNHKYYVGERAMSISQNEAPLPVSKVILLVDDENFYEAGTDEGTVFEVDCPYATQAMADSVLNSLKGYQYRAVQVEGANLSPLAELGDGITVGGEYVPMMRQLITFANTAVVDFSSPEDSEVKHEYQYQSPIQKQIIRNMAKARSLITKTSEEINLKVEGLDGRVSDVTQTVDGISLSVTSSSSPDGETTAKITLKVGPNNYTGYIKIDGNVNVSGQLSADALYAALGEIADLTVDRLSTSRRVAKYLAGDKSDDNFVRIHDQYIEFVSGVYADGTAQAENPHGALLYWESDPSGASIGSDGYPYVNGERIFTTTTKTGWPVMIYTYTELVKRSIAFEQDGSGTYTPVDVFGAGNADGTNKARMLKSADGLELTYATKSGNQIGFMLGNSGYTDIMGLRKSTGLNFSEWDSGRFYERIDGDDTRYAYNVEFDSQGRPIKITDSTGHETAIYW